MGLAGDPTVEALGQAHMQDLVPSQTNGSEYQVGNGDTYSPSKPSSSVHLPASTAIEPDLSLPASRNQSFIGGSETPPGEPESPTTAQVSQLEVGEPHFLYPVDRGHHAWMFLVGATVVETLVWGLPFAIGVLHLYWTTELFPNGGSSMVTLASTLQAGLLYMSVAVFGPIMVAYPRYTKHMQIAGSLIAAIGIIASAFVTEPWHLIITMGLLYPFATASYVPCATLLFEWFSAKRGSAAGIMYAGTGIGGTIYPLIISGLINKFGYKAAMVSIGIAHGALILLALIPIKRRVPLPRKESGPAPRRAVKYTVPEFVKGKLVWCGFVIILLSSCGSFIPSLWLPAFADDLHISPGGTGLISIMNAASVPGNAVNGYLTDRYPLSSVIMMNCLMAGLSCLFLWGFGTSSGPLIAFVLLFGLFALSFASLWTGMISMTARDEMIHVPMIFSIFAFGRGIGSFASGPLSDSLLGVDVLKGAAGAYGVKNYGILLIFTGLSIVVAGALGLFFTESKKQNVTNSVR